MKSRSRGKARGLRRLRQLATCDCKLIGRVTSRCAYPFRLLLRLIVLLTLPHTTSGWCSMTTPWQPTAFHFAVGKGYNWQGV
ncbi:hypothetical protein GY45DRAFT_206297 [Cubamyces sp. BRFM 1775]|nr:hypothetical protein GY45DRAFT_206297 [Cubamyces sp. BRFM 1775]